MNFTTISQSHILLIMNCVKYRYKSVQQINGWLKHLPSTLQYFHVLGDPQSSEPFYFDWESNVLWVKCEDDYNSLPKKVILAYEAIQKTFEFQYIFKTDDDQMLTTASFFTTIINLLHKKTPKVHYGGYIVDVPFQHISKYYTIHPELPTNLVIEKIKYCNGRFYLLSKEAVADLVSKKEEIQKEYLEDYAIGLHLHLDLKQDMLFIDTKKYFQDGTP